MTRWNKSVERKAFTARLPVATLARLRLFVLRNKHKEYGNTLSRTKVIETAVTEYLDRMESDGKQSSGGYRSRR